EAAGCEQRVRHSLVAVETSTRHPGVKLAPGLVELPQQRATAVEAVQRQRFSPGSNFKPAVGPDARVWVPKFLRDATVLLNEGFRPLALEVRPDRVIGGSEEPGVGASSVWLVGAACAEREGQRNVGRDLRYATPRPPFFQVVHHRA